MHNISRKRNLKISTVFHKPLSTIQASLLTKSGIVNSLFASRQIVLIRQIMIKGYEFRQSVAFDSRDKLIKVSNDLPGFERPRQLHPGYFTGQTYVI
jgi:hypothetical protein